MLEVNNSRGDVLKNLSKINIFIGENNSGKSRLLREILKNDLQYIPTYSIEGLNQILRDLKTKIEEPFLIRKGKPFSDLANRLDPICEIKYIFKDSSLLADLEKLKEYLVKLSKDSGTSTANFNHSDIGNKLLPIFQEKFDLIWEKFPESLDPPKFTKIFIPILRGVKPLNNEKYEDLYFHKVCRDYFDNKIPDFIIFTGMSAYDDIKNHLLGDLTQRKLIKDYEEYLSRTFFNNQPVTIIPSEKSKHLTIKIGQEKEQPIQELGDGLQSIIILTLPLFLHKYENVLLFVDEPEMFIHPGLQRKIVETLLREDGFENFQFFITTHSNHFLDVTIDYEDISIFVVRKGLVDKGEKDEITPIFIIDNLSFGDHSALELLGVRNSSVFLSNCTIWIEGITDRMYFRHFLALFFERFKEKKRFKEDLHYSFVEYSGTNITHWSITQDNDQSINVDRLCGRLFLIADKDENKEKRHLKLKNVLGERVYILKCREVENLIEAPILKKIIQDYEKNPVLDINFQYSDYKNKPLGKFIESKLGKNKQRIGRYSTESGTISDKINFCNKALKNIKSWDDLSPEAKIITKKIYDFIESKNSS
jgi:AAA15 family ATPase/GTPase